MTDLRHEVSRRGLLALGTAAAISVATRGGGAEGGKAAKLFSTESGEGLNVVLLHGWTCDSHDWSWQIPAFAERWRVIAPDLRGHGRSEIPPSDAYLPDDYVADVEALLANVGAEQRFVVVGHSMGGQIAARLAAKRPDLVRAVVSVDGALGFSDEVGQAFARVTQALQSGAAYEAAQALFKSAYDPSTDPALKVWHARRVRGMPQHVVRESFGPLFVGPHQVGVGEASARFCSGLTVPVYHLCRDPAQAERMRSWFIHPKSKVDVWDHAGHWIMQDRPKDVNAAVAAWIDDI